MLAGAKTLGICVVVVSVMSALGECVVLNE